MSDQRKSGKKEMAIAVGVVFGLCAMAAIVALSGPPGATAHSARELFSFSAADARGIGAIAAKAAIQDFVVAGGKVLLAAIL